MQWKDFAWVALPLGFIIIFSLLASKLSIPIRVDICLKMLTAGIILITLILDIFPPISQINHGEGHKATTVNGVAVALGFIGATVLMILLRLCLKKKITVGKDGKLVIDHSYMASAIIDIFLSGLMLGLGLGVGKETGLPLAVGTAIEIGSSFLATANQSQKKPKGELAIFYSAYGLALGVGSLVGFVLVEHLGGAKALQRPGGKFILAFGSVTYAWIVIETMIREAFVEETKCVRVKKGKDKGKCRVDRNQTVSHDTTAIASASFFFGVLAMLVGKWFGDKNQLSGDPGRDMKEGVSNGAPCNGETGKTLDRALVP